MTAVAFIGLGAMGARMAANLLAAGHSVTVHNRNPARMEPLVVLGARAAPSPRAAVEGAAMAIAMVADDAASRSVWLDRDAGALPELARDAIAIECSTLSVPWTRDLAQAAAAVGHAFLAVPVLGSLPQAEGKALIALAGGDPQVLERVRPVLSAMTGRVIPVAAPHQAALLKLAVNAMFSTQVAVLAELFAAARSAGLAPDAVLAAITDLPTTSAALAGAASLMVKGDDAPRYPIRLVEKDLRYLAAAAGSDAPVIAAVQQSFARALDQALGNRNITAIAR